MRSDTDIWKNNELERLARISSQLGAHYVVDIEENITEVQKVESRPKIYTS